MTSEPNLTLAFLESQPRSAAEAIEGIDREDAAAFLETVPGRIAGPVIGSMAPWLAAEIVELLPPAAAAGLIRNMAYQDAAGVLRLLDKDELAAVLDQLPKGINRNFRKSLNYPTGTVGAWVEHAVTTFGADDTVGDGLKFVRQRRRQVGSHLFVVDDENSFLGAVRVGDLLATSAKAPLREAMKSSVQPLSNRALLRSIGAAPEWDEYLMLPVVGRKGNVVGGLTRMGLRRGLAADRTTVTSFVSGGLWTHLLSNYLITCAGLMQLITDPVDSDRKP
jgi:Mg/Co/Ni transporter MgtE